jgi:uncharacterized membrane protein
VTASGVPFRRPYLDWLRGIGVLIMIEGHALDAWTRAADRSRDGYQWAILIAGFGAPVFLFLAGVALALAAGSRLRKGLSPREVARLALRRGAWILGLAFLFRLQSWVISGGTFPGALLKVDILNVMGVSMMIAAGLWGLGRGLTSRAAIFGAVTVLIAMLTPIVRATPWLASLPDPLEWYLRPAAGSTTFTLFPWAAFLTGGAAIGVWLDATRSSARSPGTPSRRSSGERRAILGITVAGIAVAGAGYATSFLPAIYADTGFWTSSPTFFFLRLGVVIASTGVAYALTRLRPMSVLQEFGRASLFVYWIHVEMAYGVLSMPLHRRLPFEAAIVALVLFGMLLFVLVRVKERFAGRGRSPQEPNRGQAAVRPA